MPNFAPIAARKITAESSARTRVPTVQINGGTVFLIMRPATEENRAYQEAMIASESRRAQRDIALSRGKRQAPKGRVDIEKVTRVTLEQMAYTRQRDVPLFAEHVITGWGLEYPDHDAVEKEWEGYKRPKGKAAAETLDGPMLDCDLAVTEFSAEACEALLSAIAEADPDAWDQIRGYAKTRDNFRQAPEIDAEALAGNSASG